MRGSIKQRYEGSWSIILDLGYQPDPVTGKPKRKQKWITFRGTKKDAEAKLTEELDRQNKGTFIEPSKRTLGEWLITWLAETVKVNLAPRTHATYKHIIHRHLIPKLGANKLQELRPIHLDHYYGEHREKLSVATLALHHGVLHSSLQAAVCNDYVTRNVAKLVSKNNKPRPPRPETRAEAVKQNCWSGSEARAFLDEAKARGPQPAAFYSLALESGMRKSELAGLQWCDVDLTKGSVWVRQQHVKVAGTPWMFGPLKGRNSKPRTIMITVETAALLRHHKAHQAEVKLQSGGRYHDHGLVFAKEWGARRTRDTLGKPIDNLGEPIDIKHIGDREFASIAKAAGVKRITIHGMRHTMATTALQRRPVKEVQERLGHAKSGTTLDFYAHVLEGQDQETADTLGAIFHGKR